MKIETGPIIDGMAVKAAKNQPLKDTYGITIWKHFSATDDLYVYFVNDKDDVVYSYTVLD